MKNLILTLIILVLPVLSYAKISSDKNDDSTNEYSAINSESVRINTTHKESIPVLESIWSSSVNDLSVINVKPEIHTSYNSEAVNQILKETGFASRYRSLFLYEGRKLIA